LLLLFNGFRRHCRFFPELAILKKSSTAARLNEGT
jgi:hypothetical protein